MGYFAGHSTLSSNLVSYWDMKEASGNRADSIGSDTLLDWNTVTQASNGMGPSGKAASYVAANTEILYRNSYQLPTGSLTLSLWVYPTLQPPVGQYAGIFDCTSSWPYGVQLSIYEQPSSVGGGDQVTVLCGDGSSYIYSYDLAYTYNQWNHIVVSYDTADKKLRYKINGSATSTSGALAGTRSTTACQVDFGYWYAAARQAFEGQICEAGVWSRALTNQEMLDLYNSGTGLFLRSPETATKTGQTDGTFGLSSYIVRSESRSGSIDAQSGVSGATAIGIAKTGLIEGEASLSHQVSSFDNYITRITRETNRIPQREETWNRKTLYGRPSAIEFRNRRHR